MEIFPQVLSQIKHAADTRAAPHLTDICISNKSGVRVINLNMVYLFIIHHNYSWGGLFLKQEDWAEKGGWWWIGRILSFRSSKDVVDKKVDEREVDFVQQVLDEVPQKPLHQVLDPALDKKWSQDKMISPTHPEEGVNKVNKDLQDPVQRPQTADVNVNAAKMIDLWVRQKL